MTWASILALLHGDDNDAVVADAALAHDPQSRAALEAKLSALGALQKKSRNSLEHGWLGYGIRTTQKRLDELKDKG